jgi:uncharacterized protein involved in outer membrane biogenesis
VRTAGAVDTTGEADAPPGSFLTTVLAGLIIALLVLPLVAHLMIGVETLRAPLAERLSAALGRDVQILGELQLDMGLRPHLEARHVLIANPPGWSTPFAEIGMLRLDLDLRRLLRGIVSVAELRLADVRVHFEADGRGHRTWEGLPALRRSLIEEGTVRVEIDTVRFKNVEIVYHDRASGHLRTADVARIGISGLEGGRALRMQARGWLSGAGFDLVARVDPPVATDGNAEDRRSVALRGDVFGGELNATGTISPHEDGARLDVILSASFDEIGALSRVLGWELAPVGPLAATARVAGTTARIDHAEIALELGDDALWAAASTAVGDVAGFRDVTGSLRIGGEDAALLGTLFGWKLGAVGPFRGSATFDDGDGRGIALRTVALVGGYEGEVELRVGGPVATGTAGPGLPVELRAPNLAMLGAVVRRPLPPLGAVLVNGRLVARDGSLALDDVVITVRGRDGTAIQFAGRVADVLALRGVEVGGDLVLSGLDWLAPSVGARSLRVGRLRGSVQVSDADGSLGIDRFRVERLAAPLQLRVSGTVDDLYAMDGIDVAAVVRGRDLAAIGDALGAAWPRRGPVEVSFHVRGSRQELTTDDLAVRIDGTRIRGTARASVQPNQRPRITVALRSPSLHLEDVGVGPRDTAAPVAKETVLQPTARPVALPVGVLRSVDADVRLRAERVTGRGGLVIDDASAAISLRDGTLRVRDAKLLFDGGYVAATALLATDGPMPAAWIGATATGLDLQRVSAQFSDTPVLSGVLAFEADLRSHATSIAGLLRDLQGEALLLIENGSTASTYARTFAADLTRALLAREPRAEARPIHCLVGDFAVERGVATGRTLLLDVGDLSILGRGSIDVARGALDVTLTPRFADPGRYSAPAEVKVSGSVHAPLYTRLRPSTLGSALRHLVGRAAAPLRSVFAEAAPRLAGEGPCAAALERVREGSG